MSSCRQSPNYIVTCSPCEQCKYLGKYTVQIIQLYTAHALVINFKKIPTSQQSNVLTSWYYVVIMLDVLPTTQQLTMPSYYDFGLIDLIS